MKVKKIKEKKRKKEIKRKKNMKGWERQRETGQGLIIFFILISKFYIIVDSI